MRKILKIDTEVLNYLNEYKDFVLQNRPDKLVPNWPLPKGKFKKENRSEYSTSLECLKSMPHDTHDGYPPDSYGYDLNELTISKMIQHDGHKFSPEERKNLDLYIEKSRWVDENIGHAIGFRDSALKMFYPEDGYIAWHTNWNAAGYNCLFTWSDGSGYWRHINPEGSNSPRPNLGQNIEEWSQDNPNWVHIQDEPGWHCKIGYYGKKDEHERIVWHSAYGGPRITLGFIVYDKNIWDDIVEELTSEE
jgi:hypothetical protein